MVLHSYVLDLGPSQNAFYQQNLFQSLLTPCSTEVSYLRMVPLGVCGHFGVKLIVLKMRIAICHAWIQLQYQKAVKVNLPILNFNLRLRRTNLGKSTNI